MAGIMLLSVFGAIGIFCYIIYIIWEHTEWQEFCPSSPIIGFEKLRTLYEIDKSKWDLRSDYAIFTNDRDRVSLGLSFRDYLKYKKYYRYLNKKHATADAESKQRDFEDTLDKYLESKISKIQNDLRKNTEELKQRTEDYNSDFECVDKELEDLYRKSECNSWIEDTEIGKIMHVRKGTVSIYDIKSIHEQGYIIMLEKEKVK